MWKLDRPRPALPNSYFWTWDHRTNFVLDDPGTLNFGCYNKYMKRPETFVEDYRRLTDLSSGLGIKGIVVWGFLRDSHGGIEYAKQVADYAAARGVAIMPGLGTSWYGGIYYEGDHPYNLETFLAKNPEARLVGEDGEPFTYAGRYGACFSSPAFLDWLNEGIEWLCKEFQIGGVNVENGDFVVCYCDKCSAANANWLANDPDFCRCQGLSYEPSLKALQRFLDGKLLTYATYTGFLPGKDPSGLKILPPAHMDCERPAMLDRLPESALAQWSLTRMLHEQALPLTTYLDNGTPEEALTNPAWPFDVHPPSKRSVGFIHQGSHASIGRYSQIVSSIKEMCLRAYRSGLEGVSIYGEVSPRHIPWALNYLAFSHFTHWPEDNLREFGRKTLGQVLKDEDEGEQFVCILAAWDAGSLSEDQKKQIQQIWKDASNAVSAGKDLERWRFWDWLIRVQDSGRYADPVSFL